MKKLDERDRENLKEAIRLQKKDIDNQALGILQELIERHPDNVQVNGFLGLVLAKTGSKRAAIPHIEMALKVRPDHELLHLSLYVCYATEERYDIAFATLFKYLSRNPANLFKDTLVELLEGLLKGYGTTHKNKILFYAKENDLDIPDGLID